MLLTEAVHQSPASGPEQPSRPTARRPLACQRLNSGDLLSRCGCALCRTSELRPADPLATTGASSTAASGPTAAASLQVLADYLRLGFWYDVGTSPRAFNLSSSGVSPNNGTLRYNVSGWNYGGDGDSNGLTNPRRELVRSVLAVYQASLGITFVETSDSDDSVDLFFADNQAGAYADSQVASGDVIDFSVVNVASNWYGGNSSFASYTVQTFFHEVGHALGLGHQGPYNGSATYGTDAKFANDSWQLTMMSYFSQSENPTTGSGYAFLQTPMPVDWLALDDLYRVYGYGVADAFSGDTIYGVGTNISASTSRIWNEFSSYANRSAYAIIDHDGYDTLDVSNFSASQTINLSPTLPGSTTASLSSIGGRVGNLSFAVGTIIEAAITGSGNDRLIGNDANNALRGGAGRDTMDGGEGSDLYLIVGSSEHPAAEVNDSGTSGTDELRFDSNLSGDTLVVFVGDRGLERVVIGSGVAATPVISGTKTLNVNATAAANALAIIGNDGSNAIIGSAFVDSLNGGEGSDIYVITDSAQHSAAEIDDKGLTGSDELRFAATTAGQTLTIFAGDLGLERVCIGTGLAATAITTARTPLNINASSAANGLIISGNSGSNAIIGSAFVDLLDGGEGADIYVVTDSAQHLAAEINDSGLSGSDELRFAASSDGLTLTVFAADLGLERVSIGTGMAASAISTATTALHVDASAAANALVITGNAGPNAMRAGNFDDLLIGGLGLDSMDGGEGSDLYLINSSNEHGGAEINDSGLSGSDELRFTATSAGQILTVFAADCGLERISIGTGSATSAVSTATTALGVNAVLAPNALVISGNAGSNTLLGSGFDDLLLGAGGLDSMNGSDGSDIYLINSPGEHSAAEINDTGLNGSDELRFAASIAGQTLRIFAADLGLERISIGSGMAAAAVNSATTALNIDAALAPNALRISGNAGSNVLTGSAFVDTLDGGEGSDIYLISNASQHPAAEINDSGLSGSDELRFAATSAGQTLTVFAGDLGLERISIGSGTGANAISSATTTLHIDASLAPNALVISGNAGANRLSGSAFNDTLIGGAGLDTLSGGGGADCFYFNTAISLMVRPDRLIDFSPAQADWIALDSSVFTGLGQIGFLDSSAFTIGSIFTASPQRLLYNPANGVLTYDSNGSTELGVVVAFATLPLGLESQMSSSLFRIV